MSFISGCITDVASARRFVIVLALTSIPAHVHGQAGVTTTEITRADLKKRLEIIADDSMLGRDAGQIGNVRATNYIVRELTRLGVQPAGVDGYFQTIPLMQRVPSTGAIEVEGKAYTGDDVIALRSLGGAPYGGEFARSDVATIYGGKVGGEMIDPALTRGKVVVFEPVTNNAGAVSGAFAGANGVMSVYTEAAALLFAGSNRVPAPTIANLRSARIVLADPAETPHVIPAALIPDAAVAALFGGPLSGLQIGAQGKTISGHFSMTDTKLPAPARNVIGIIRGTDPKLRGEFVGIGSHSDHVGTGPAVDHDSVRAFNAVMRPLGANDPIRTPTPEQAAQIQAIRDSAARVHPPRLDSIFNGADDDGSGTDVELEIAEYYAKHPMKRSLLLIFHTAEEKGLFGSIYFTNHPTVPLDSVVAVVNMDQLSRGGPNDVPGTIANTLYALGTRRVSKEMGDLYESVNAAPGHLTHFDYRYDAPGQALNAWCRADHYSYARYGIPASTIFAGWDRDYHQVSDEPQYASAETMYQISMVVRDIISTIANLDHRLKVDVAKGDPHTACRQ